MKIKKLTLGAVFVAMALIVFVIENQIPPPLPIVGFRIGLANVFTLITLSLWDRKYSLIILLMRIFLSWFICSSGMAILYSLAGGITSFIVSAVLLGFIGKKYLPIIGIFSAMTHSIAQIGVAAIILKSVSIFVYIPILCSLSIVTGLFTGYTALMVSKNKLINTLFLKLRRQ